MRSQSAPAPVAPVAPDTSDNISSISFADLGLAEPILQALQKEGYTVPTPIQRDAIPYLLNGRDVLGIAQTGTGKTAAFVLPLLHKIRETKSRAKPKHCTALILTPTRELANQVAASVDTYGRAMKVMTAVVVGGVKYGPQIKRLGGGIDVLIATPGRLEDLMKSGAISLSETRNVVLDEADQMLDLGFAPAIRRILGLLPKDRQTALFSATMETKIRKLAQEFLSRPAEVSVSPDAMPIAKIEQGVVYLQSASKRAALVKILSAPEMTSAIVFSRTKHGAEKLADFLVKADISAGSIHGNKNQRQRERALAAFRSGKTPVLVATDVAARGIDVNDVSHVINFDLPNVAEAYVHRIGRTGRAGKSGIAIALCDSSERGLLRDIERLIKTSIPVIQLEGFASANFVVPTDADDGVKRHRKGSGGGGRRDGAPGGRGDGGRAEGGRAEGGRGKPGVPDWKKRTTDRNNRKKADNSYDPVAGAAKSADANSEPAKPHSPKSPKPGTAFAHGVGKPGGAGKPAGTGGPAGKGGKPPFRGAKPGGKPGGKFQGKPGGAKRTGGAARTGG